MALVCGMTLGALMLRLYTVGHAQRDISSPVQRPKQAPLKTPSTTERDAIAAAEQQAIAAFEQGQQAHARGDLHTAIAFYDTALEIIPDFPEALFQRAMARLAQKQPDRAQADLERLLALKPTILSSSEQAADGALRSFFARAHSALADIYRDRQDAVNAEQHYRHAVALDGTLQRATTHLVWLLIERNALEEASARLDALLATGAASASIYGLQGYLYEQSGQSDRALAAYDQAIALDARDLLARQRRSRLRVQRQDFAGAAEDMAVVYEQDRSPSRALELGALYELAGKPTEAIALYEAVLKSTNAVDETRQARLKLVNLLTTVQRQAEALAHAQHLMKESPQDGETLARLGSALLTLDPALAAQAYAQALKGDEQNVDYRVGLSAAFLKMRQYSHALNVALEAVKRAPDHYYAHTNAATALFQLQQFAAAAEHFEWIVAHKPDTAIAYYFLGICYDKLGQYERALPAYETFLRLANADQHRAEADNVRFRLPAVRRAIEKQRGKKR